MDNMIRNMFNDSGERGLRAGVVMKNNMRKKLSKQFSFCEANRIRPFLRRRAACVSKDNLAEEVCCSKDDDGVSTNSRHSWHLDEDGRCTCCKAVPNSDKNGCDLRSKRRCSGSGWRSKSGPTRAVPEAPPNGPKLPSPQNPHTAPVTPSRGMIPQSRLLAASTPHLSTGIDNTRAPSGTIATEQTQITESVLQKFRKTFSLRFNKKTEGESTSAPPSPPESTGTKRSDTMEKMERYRFGPLIWRASKERKKTKAQRSAKCNSGDSGIQIEPSELGSCSVGVDSCDEGGTCDAPDSLTDSGNVRPPSDMSRILFERLKAELTKGQRHPNVRRAHSDIGSASSGGQRLLQWGANRRLNHCLGPNAPQRPHFGSLRSRRMRRSLSQPDIDKFNSPLLSRRRNLRNGQLTDEERTSEDDCASDSGSSLSHADLLMLNVPATHMQDSQDSSCPDCEDCCAQGTCSDPVCPGVWGEAVWDHVAMDPEELALKAGQTILILDRRDDDWWWGQANHKTGWFPAAFVRLLVSQDVPTQVFSTPRYEAIRASVVLELIHTERDFVNLMTDVADGYIAECKRRPDMFTDEQITNVFSNLEDLLDFQRMFLSDLEKCINWDSPHASCVGEVFLNNKSGFRLYSEYCNTHPIAIATLQALLTSQPHAHFMEACRLLRGLPPLPLGGHLLAPVQRICKYPLQLAELLKYTPQDHGDFKHIQEALTCMRGVAILINERKRKMESLEKIADWQRRVEGWEGEDLIEISSQLIHQGDAVRVSTGMWSTSVTLFLFDHQLIYCKKDILKRSTYMYKGRIYLDEAEIFDIPDGKDAQLGLSLRHCFKVYSCTDNKWIVFCVRSANSKEKWLNAFKRERQIVAEDNDEELKISPQAKRLAALANSKCIAVSKSWNTADIVNASLSRKVGTWFKRSKAPHGHNVQLINDLSRQIDSIEQIQSYSS